MTHAGQKRMMGLGAMRWLIRFAGEPRTVCSICADQTTPICMRACHQAGSVSLNLHGTLGHQERKFKHEVGPVMVTNDFKLDSLLNQLCLEWGGLMPRARVDTRDEAG